MASTYRSYYNPSERNEQSRLTIQADRVIDEDLAVLRRAISHLPQKDDLIALDAGCANGYVTVSRFTPFFPPFALILGVDKNEEMIERASERFNDDSRFIFRSCDFDRCANLSELISDRMGICFDLIYCANTLHHLAAPGNLLAQMSAALKKNGVLVYKGVDDGTKLCFPYYEYLQRILSLTINPRVHASDRFFSRKLPGLARQAGLEEVFSEHKGIDTFGMTLNQRKDLFQESFSYRLRITQDALSRKKDNANLIHKKMKQLLAEFEKFFLKDDFYYLENTMWFVFKKRIGNKICEIYGG